MLEFNVSRAVSAAEEVTAELLETRAQIVSLIAAHSRPDRNAALLSRSRTSAARQLILRVCSDITAWEQQSGKRVYKRRSRSREIFSNAVERFVGDLLRAKADKNAGFEPGHKVTISGRAARFWATPKLLKLAEEHGISSG